MPILGEIKKAREVGRRGQHKYTWVICPDCDRERWVMLRYGEPRSKRCHSCSKMGERHPNWKGGLKYGRGYIYVLKPEHPHANIRGYVNHARLILEQKLGRYLLEGYEPHHINGIRDDDRPINLMELSHSEHRKVENNPLRDHEL